jgi:pimeloyl-ACP methyl ester carboxylesterase
MSWWRRRYSCLTPSTLKQITVAGVRLMYMDVGARTPSGGSPLLDQAPLLLLHGLLATAETLSVLIRNLPQDRRIVALDVLSAAPVDGPLEGNQPKGDKLNTRAEALADLVGEFAKRLGLERAVVIGHSHGGTLALWLAAAHTQPGKGNDIKALALLSPAHPFEGYRSHVVAFYLTRWGRFLALSIPLAPRWMILRAYNEAAGPGRPITVAHLKPYMRVLRSRRTLARVLQMLHTWEADMSDLRRAMLVRPIAQPALLIWGDHDTVVPLSTAAALQRHLAASELNVLEGSGHLLAEEAPEQCGRLICDWLARVDSEIPSQEAVQSLGQNPDRPNQDR